MQKFIAMYLFPNKKKTHTLRIARREAVNVHIFAQMLDCHADETEGVCEPACAGPTNWRRGSLAADHQRPDEGVKLVGHTRIKDRAKQPAPTLDEHIGEPPLAEGK